MAMLGRFAFCFGIAVFAQAAPPDCNSKCDRNLSPTDCRAKCMECNGERSCTDQKMREVSKERVRLARDKFTEAENLCQPDEEEFSERKRCFEQKGDELPQPTSLDTDENRKGKNKNIRKFQEQFDDAEKERKGSKMTELFGVMRDGGSKDAIDRKKRDACDRCLNATNASAMAHNNSFELSKVRLCINSCVKDGLEELEVQELRKCHNASNASTSNRSACFCKPKPDDAQRNSLSKAKFARRSKGALDFICKRWMECKESDEVECDLKMEDDLDRAKHSCNNRHMDDGDVEPEPESEEMDREKQRIKLDKEQLLQMCKEKQVDRAERECKDGMKKGKRDPEVTKCITDTTGLTKGKVRQAERKNSKGKMQKLMIECETCTTNVDSDGVTTDCPEVSECPSIVRQSIMEETGSDCEGNFQAMVGNLSLARADADGTSTLVSVPRKGCEIYMKFKAGRGQCRADGELRSELKEQIATNFGVNAGVVGLADGESAPQLEQVEDDSTFQTAYVTLAVDDSVADDEVETICTNAQTTLARRLAELTSSDLLETAGTQATATCVAGDTTCAHLTLIAATPAPTSSSTTSAGPNISQAGSMVHASTLIAMSSLMLTFFNLWLL